MVGLKGLLRGWGCCHGGLRGMLGWGCSIGGLRELLGWGCSHGGLRGCWDEAALLVD